MKTLKTLLLCLVVAAFVSCDNDNDPTNNVCDESYISIADSNFFTAANGYTLEETMDLLNNGGKWWIGNTELVGFKDTEFKYGDVLTYETRQYGAPEIQE